VLVRLTKIEGADLRLFDFDYDLTWAAFFLSADEKVYGRYGGRDAASAEGRLSLAGLRYAMRAGLDAHRRDSGERPPPRAGKPVLAEDYAAKLHKGRGCIHCHQVKEFRRELLRAEGRWNRDDVWVYPLPENIGLTLEVDRGDRVRAVKRGSPAARAGVLPGDTLRSINGMPVASFADAQYALHRTPARGHAPISWEHDGQTRTAGLDLAEGWRRTNLTWRPSMLDLLPSLSLSGDDLTAVEKQALGLSAKRLAFRQDKIVHSSMRAVGVRAGDIILGIDNRPLEMTADEFLAHVRKNYLVGDRVTLNVLRDGKRLDLPLKLR
jgi:hypothetical protein